MEGQIIETVGELVAVLAKVDQRAPVVGLWDTLQWEIHGVYTDPKGVVILDVGSGAGDAECVSRLDGELTEVK